MTLAHFHLATVHIPVVAFPLFLILLVVALIFKKRELQRASLVGFAAVALLSVPVFLSGEEAEEIVEDLAGVSEHQIEVHESAATVGFALVLFTGALSLAATASAAYRPAWLKPVVNTTALSALATTAVLLWVANEGGRIRHSEIRDSSQQEAGVTSRSEARKE